MITASMICDFVRVAVQQPPEPVRWPLNVEFYRQLRTRQAREFWHRLYGACRMAGKPELAIGVIGDMRRLPE